MQTIHIDFAKADGAVRPLHGVNCAPYGHGGGWYVTKSFQQAKIPYSRLHDCMGGYGGAHFVDIPNIFPDFDADECDPANYDFTLTDDYIGSIVKAGTKIVYRLGITIDWGIKKYHTQPPKDYDKWARICEHVIRHYNEGWADGFTWAIQDWEIWNEPENPPMWSGTKEDFFRLYVTAAKHLKACFPNLKIGGYGGCGFYAITRENVGDFLASFVPYFTEFLDCVRENDAPLDFYSWHIYNDDPEEILTHARYVRETLDAKGFTNTESSLNEWNYGTEGTSHLEKKTMRGAVYVASTMAALQQSGIVDTAMYYVASLHGVYNGLFRAEDKKYMKPYYALCAWGELWSLGQYHLPMPEDAALTGGPVYAAAASGGAKAGVCLTNMAETETQLELDLSGLAPGQICKFYILDEDHDMTLTRTEVFRGDRVMPVVHLPGRSVVYVALEKST